MKNLALRPLLWSALCASLTLGLSSCNKDKEEFGPNAALSAEDNADAEADDAASYEYVDAGAPEDISRGGITAINADDQRILFGCASHIYDAATRTLTIDFGPAGCVGRDGKLRKGQVVAVFTGQHRQVGSSVTISLVGYSVNGNPRTGTRTITWIGQGVHTVNVQNASVTTANGIATWSAQRTVAQTAGLGTRTIQDDVYSVTGTAAGVNRKGVSFTATIQQPLVKKFQAGCARHFVSGIIDIATSKEKNLQLNYDPAGTQACDNIATLTVNGRTRTIQLR
ncbi:hypothetical protein F0P96_14120 [Hymenobacter busanensis]|uniref:Uncharacterized protein n=1 Tax=Hymenobacter busanensis TaxID=2607656 RepID=A0A7L4ZZ30_9BACT|nr:hypothetical protein [Hymenobacter busanensis]KAA9331378.1 hypothetical protein F0P96_14120 [Hymenobacter busanensis]QHJ08531.1 hypothetical protein GUY19_15045 [Hymenobacter busanensis]